MDLHLFRTYFEDGTNGDLWCGEQLVCHTIELPWRDNKRNISCIPDGVYSIHKRYSEKFGWHLWLPCVVGRVWILIHPANNALVQLKGCIAPVSRFAGAGLGTGSRAAGKKLRDLVFPALEMGKEVNLHISMAF